MESITRLQQIFTTWQASSPKKRYTNADLRKEAVKYLEHYTHGEVSKAIGIPVSTLRSWQRSLYCQDQTETNHSPAFIAMDLDPTTKDTNEKNQSVFLKINLPSGIVIQIESKSPTSSAAFVMALNKELHSCSI